MSTDPTGDAAIGRAIMTDAQAQLDAADVPAEQLDLLAPITAEDIWAAREALGVEAGHAEVTREARERRRGRPKGSRNRRTDQLEQWLLSHGQHPAVTLMQIQSTSAEALMEASKRRKVHSFGKDGALNIVIEHMTYSDAQSLRVRAADILMPYLVGKKPITVDMNFSGVADLIMEGYEGGGASDDGVIDAEYLPIADGSGEDVT